MNDDFTQDSSVIEPKPQADYGAPDSQSDSFDASVVQAEPETQAGTYEETGAQTGTFQQSGDFRQTEAQTGTYQQQTGSYEQTGTQAGAYQQQTGSYQQPNANPNIYSQQNPYSNPGTNSYTNANMYTNANPYSNGNTYSTPYQQNTNQSQNLYYGQASQNKEDSIGFGVASMVLGILSIFTFVCCINYIFAILAIIFGIVQLVKSKKKGMAITGIITAAISIIIATIFWIAAASEGKTNFSDFDNYQQFMEQESL
ncbi:MAG: hypothetical protein ACI4FX_02160 [Agathobacter sp.]